MRASYSLLTVIVVGLLGSAGCGRPLVSAAPQMGGTKGEERTAHLAKSGNPTAEKAPKADPGGFRFPDDRGGRLLARLLPPPEKSAVSPTISTGPRRAPASSALEQPAQPLPAASGGSRPPLAHYLPVEKPSRALRPGHLPEDWPLTGYRIDPLPPQVHSFLAGERTRTPSADVNRPLPLPLLAQPVIDRASLEDPTGEASVAAALARILPSRTNPAPFLRLTLPDPFEYRNTVRVRTPPPEDATPAGGAPRTP